MTDNVTRSVVTAAGLPGLSGYGGGYLCINSSGTKVYASSPQDGKVFVIDTAAFTSTAITVGTVPESIAITPSNSKVYVANTGDSTVSVIDTASNTVSATVTIGGGTTHPIAVGINPSGTECWVTAANGFIYIINTTTNTISTSFTMTYAALGHILFKPDGTKCYVYANGGVKFDVIDTGTHAITQLSCAILNDIALSADGLSVYGTSYAGGLEVFTIASNTWTTHSLTGVILPTNMAVSGSALYVFGSDQYDGTVFKINPSTFAVLAAWHNATGGICNSSGSVLYGTAGRNLQFIDTSVTAPADIRYQCFSSDGNVNENTIVNSGFLVNTAEHTFTIISPGAGSYKFYIDGALCGTLNGYSPATTNASLPMAPVCSLTTLVASPITLGFSSMYVEHK